VARRALGVGSLALLLSGCSGEAFRLAEADPLGSAGIRPDAGDGMARDGMASAPPPLQPEARQDLPAAAAIDAGILAGPTRPTSMATPAVAACGALRLPSPELANAEVCVGASTFTMGGTTGVPAGYVAHAPEHVVTLSAYVLDAYEVSVARYRGCVSAGACAPPGENPVQGCTYSALPGDNERYPVTCVPWQGGQDFCAWDGGRRLPSEAEWERAARGPQRFVYPWGNDFTCARAVLAGASECDSYAGTLPRPVGSTPQGQSAEHAFDLAGNAWEWVADRSGAYPSGSVVNPQGPLAGSARIQRGGGWQTPAAAAFAYLRRAEAAGAIGPTGFRCARDAVE
jgi:formylglycine-generating enzyme required for sulfatase activity